jgi:hypothetical protein
VKFFKLEPLNARKNGGYAATREASATSGWMRPMRLMLIVVTVAVATLFDLRVSQATQMPWCAGTSKGDFFSYNCSLPTYEMCVQEVIAGNRGFCSPNPYYRRPEFVPPRAKRKR